MTNAVSPCLAMARHKELFPWLVESPNSYSVSGREKSRSEELESSLKHSNVPFLMAQYLYCQESSLSSNGEDNFTRPSKIKGIL